MGLTNDVIIDTRKAGEDSVNVYFRIPRTPDLGFQKWMDRKHIIMNMEMWEDYDTRLEQPEYDEDGVLINPGKKPLRVIPIRVLSGTHDEVYGTPAVPAVPAEYDEEGNIVSEEIPAIPAVEGLPHSNDEYICSYYDIIDNEEMRQYLLNELVNGSDDTVDEIQNKYIVSKVYGRIKADSDFCGIDMTTALYHP